MSEKHTILKGTFILTATGFLSRFIGFFYRMFLSHTFGEESVGLYQLIFPIYALCFSLTTAGIEVALSRCVARKVALSRHKEARQLLYVGLFLSIALSTVTAAILQTNASAFSIYILGDIRCEPLLIAISYSLPFASVHSCICGYYLGRKQTKIPALAQLIEQIARVFSVYVIYMIALKKEQPVTILFAVIGLVIGEIVSSLFCIQCFTYGKVFARIHFILKNNFSHLKELLKLSVPLTANRILLNILQSIEAISIPIRLQQYGYTSSDALSAYGVLTGMALPCILFPSAITNAVSTMLLPTVTEIQTSNNWKQLKKLIQKVILYCFSLGFFCCILFLLFGNWIGTDPFLDLSISICKFYAHQYHKRTWKYNNLFSDKYFWTLHTHYRSDCFYPTDWIEWLSLGTPCKSTFCQYSKHPVFKLSFKKTRVCNLRQTLVSQ